MTLRHLKLFISVVDLGSMTAASKAHFIAQPTISQAISELEDYYGVKLFDRLSKRLFITEQGKELLSYARHITNLFNEMEQVAKNQDKVGIIKIGASVTVGTYLLPKLVNEFAKIHPLIQINAITKNTKDIESLIIKNEIDFAVVEGEVHNTNIISTPFMDDHLVLICGKTHPLYKSKVISKFELKNHNLILRELGSGTRELFENMMTLNEIKWHSSWECNGSDGLISAAINGIGIAVISQKLVEDQVKTGELSIIKMDDIDFKRKFNIIQHKNKYLTNTMKKFIDLCCKYKLA